MSGIAGDDLRGARLFAVVPAAGLSRRMGQPKLLLPLGETTVIGALLDVLADSGVTRTYVVTRRDDAELAREVRRYSARLVRPDVDPPDMRTSVEAALATIAKTESPAERDGWLLVPGDHPVLSATVVRELAETWWRSDAEILLPTHEGRRGHPTFFRWSLATAVAAIPADRGLNHLVRSQAADVVEVPVADAAVLTDLDTPADYAALRERRQER